LPCQRRKPSTRVNDYGLDEAAFSTRLNDVADEEDFFTQGFATEETEDLNEVNDYGLDEAAFSTRLNDVADEEDFFAQGFATEETEASTR
jgi:hypothetical protein